jgi:hypothetical protein
MEARSAFTYDPTINVTAAQIGINKWEWEFLNEADEKKAKQIMQEHKFDVLPIKSKDGAFRQFFATKTWNNYDSLQLSAIDQGSSIYYNTSTEDRLNIFTERKGK